MLTTQIIGNLIRDYMGLEASRVVIYNQRRNIGTDGGLWITVGQMGVKTFGNNRRSESTSTGMAETVAQHVQEMISIDILSKDESALERWPEVVAALASTAAQQAQETYSMRFASLPSGVTDVSVLEASAMLYRMNVTLNVLRSYNVTKSIDYYDTFAPVELHSENE